MKRKRIQILKNAQMLLYEQKPISRVEVYILQYFCEYLWDYSVEKSNIHYTTLQIHVSYALLMLLSVI